MQRLNVVSLYNIWFPVIMLEYKGNDMDNDNDKALKDLINELNTFQSNNNLPRMCALEQLYMDYVTSEQFDYLYDFCRRWDKVVNK